MKGQDLFESLLPEFFDEGAIRVPPITYRIDNQGERLYARPKNDEGDLAVVPSVTTILRMLPTPQHLVKWHTEFGSYEEAREHVARRANYGTFMHLLFKDFLLGGVLQFTVQDLADSFAAHLASIGETTEGYDLKQIAQDLRQDLFAFAKWCQDYQVKPLAIEYIVFGEKWAGAADLICEITVTETKTRKIKATHDGLPFMRYDQAERWGTETITQQVKKIALVDFKSGRKGFHYENVLQLHALRELWNAEHPDLAIEILANFGCKNYRLPLGKSEPYNYKDHSETEDLAKAVKHWPLLVESYHLEPIEIKDRVEFVEIAQISRESNLGSLVQRVDVRGAVLEKIKASKEENGGENERQNTESEAGPEIAGDREDQNRGEGRKRGKRAAPQSRLF